MKMQIQILRKAKNFCKLPMSAIIIKFKELITITATFVMIWVNFLSQKKTLPIRLKAEIQVMLSITILKGKH